MFKFALAIGLGLFVVGIIAIAWACFTCVKEMLWRINSYDNDDDTVEDEDDVE